MPKNLTTDWVIIATSGKTIDGRVIEKKWLEDMAETYSPKVYSAKINLDHEFELFGPQGNVQFLKVEPATEPQLRGDIHLMAKLCPSDDLVYLNRRGRFTHSSIEVKKNFRETGKFYLGGLAVTDKPASVGTTELQFTESDNNLIFGGADLNFSEIDSAPESDVAIESFINFFKTLLPKHKGESQDTAMDKEQFNQLTTTQNKTNELLETLIGKFTAQPAPAPTPAPTPKTDPVPESKTEEFVSKKDYDELATKFTELDEKFTALQKTPAPSTTPAGDDASATSGVIC
jgi:hypothetical protein